MPSLLQEPAFIEEDLFRAPLKIEELIYKKNFHLIQSDKSLPIKVCNFTTSSLYISLSAFLSKSFNSGFSLEVFIRFFFMSRRTLSGKITLAIVLKIFGL